MRDVHFVSCHLRTDGNPRAGAYHRIEAGESASTNVPDNMDERRTIRGNFFSPVSILQSPEPKRGVKKIAAAQRINLASAQASPHSSGTLRMNTKYLEEALRRVANPDLLVNIVSRRVRQLAQGHRPLTQTEPRMDHADVALKEISEGKIGYEIVDEEKVVKD